MIEADILKIGNRKDVLKSINFDFEEFKTLSNGTTVFPGEVKPINTYGDEIISYNYKPISSNSILIINTTISVSSSSGTNLISAAVFINDEVYSLGAMPSYQAFAAGAEIITFDSKFINQSLDEVNIKVRMGGRNASSTVTFNKYFAGDTASTIMIEEFKI